VSRPASTTRYPCTGRKVYRERDFGPGSFSVTESLAPRLLSLPMYPELGNEQARRVADAVAGFAAEPAREP